MADDRGGKTEIEENGGGVDRIITLSSAQGRLDSFYDFLEARKRDLEIDDQRRIAEGETLPWLGRRESWLDPK